MRKHWNEWYPFYMVLGSLLLACFTILHFGDAYNDRHRLCSVVEKVYVCAGYQYNSECRADMKNGRRITTRGLVAEGDTYCWIQP